ncbi:MAG: alpha/beta hydrolase [Solobacterium sp.]|nr:alpha/beta hydrolase [Solobacterium sp.]
MGNFIINVIGIFLLMFLGVWIYNKLHPGAFDRKLEERARNARAKFVKTDSERRGRRVIIPREGKDGVAVNLYTPSHPEAKMPVVFVCHGGTFMDGDADMLDSFCDRMKDQWEAVIMNINYTKIDVHQIPYPQEEIVDTVMYTAVHAEQFHADAHRFAFVGFSAGAYLQTGAAAMLSQKDFRICGQIAFYPFIDDTQIRMCDSGYHIGPYYMVTTGKDMMKDRESIYEQHLRSGNVEYERRHYDDAVQGFVEYNNPEIENNPAYRKSAAISEEQKELARACEVWVGSILDRFWN